MTSDEAVNDNKNYNGNVHSNWQTVVICYLTITREFLNFSTWQSFAWIYCRSWVQYNYKDKPT